MEKNPNNNTSKKNNSKDKDFKINEEELSKSSNLIKNYYDIKHIDCLSKECINDLSHELRTPISIISGFSKLLKERRDIITKEKFDFYLESIIKESDKLKKLADDLLDKKEIMISKEDNLNKNNKSLFIVSEKRDIERDIEKVLEVNFKDEKYKKFFIDKLEDFICLLENNSYFPNIIIIDIEFENIDLCKNIIEKCKIIKAYNEIPMIIFSKKMNIRELDISFSDNHILIEDYSLEGLIEKINKCICIVCKK